YVASYIHGAYRMGVLVGLSKEASDVGKDVAMQIAAMNPVAVDAASVPAETITRERDIVIEQMKQDPKMAGKPDEMLSKIAEGKLNAFFKESTLLQQAFVRDNSKAVAMTLLVERDYLLPIYFPQKEAMNDEELFAFCMCNRHLRIERDEEKQIIIKPPYGAEISIKHVEIICEIEQWNKKHKLGVA